LKAPIVVEEEGLIYVFLSPEDVEGTLESIDIPRYRAWDAEGNRLAMHAGRDGMVRLSQAEPEAHVLTQVLTTALSEKGVTPDTESGLPALVEAARVRFMDTPMSFSELFRSLLRRLHIGR
jgi:hypothetical protein